MAQTPSASPFDHRRRAVVARIPYINSLPFYLHWDGIEAASAGRWESVTLAPRLLGQTAAEGRVDAGLMSAVDVMRNDDAFEPLAGAEDGVTLGLACLDRVDSVLLFVRGPGPFAPEIPDRPQTLSPEDARILEGASIAITPDTATSVLLLRLLLEKRHRIRPLDYSRMGAEPDGAVPEGTSGSTFVQGALVIGDQALRWLHRPPEGFRLAMDLAAEWHDWTGLPFVFARWAVRRSLPEDQKRWLGAYLSASLTEAERNLPALTTGLPADLGPSDALARYLAGFTYRLGKVETETFHRFRALVEEAGLLHSEV